MKHGKAAVWPAASLVALYLRFTWATSLLAESQDATSGAAILVATIAGYL